MSKTPYPPGPTGKFPGGSLNHFRDHRLDFVMDVARNYGPAVHFRFLNRHVYFFNEPEQVHEVLVKHADAFYKTPLLKRSAARTIGDGLLTSEADFHHRQRRMMQPAFHHQRIAGYTQIMTERAEAALDQWTDGATVDIHAAMEQLTLDIVSRTLFGADVMEDASVIGEAVEQSLRWVMKRNLNPMQLPDWIPTPDNREGQRLADVLNTIVLRIIEARRKEGNHDHGDLLSMLLLARDEDDGGGMDDDQVREEAMTLFIAGHETTANALTWTLMLLAQHPDVLAKLQSEVDTLGGRTPTMADLPTLPYTDQVMKEGMRLYPPAWIISRIAVKSVTVGGWPLKKDNIVLVSPYTMHRHPTYFPDPERFQPERFAGDFESRIPRYAYFPFGGGPRVCIGNNFALMEARLLLACIVQRFSFDLLPGQNLTPEPLITLRPHAGLKMRVHVRQPVMA